MRNNLSEIFEALKGLMQGNGLAALFFNIVLDKVMREGSAETSGTIIRNLSQLLGYANNLDGMLTSFKRISRTLKRKVQSSVAKSVKRKPGTGRIDCLMADKRAIL